MIFISGANSCLSYLGNCYQQKKKNTRAFYLILDSQLPPETRDFFEPEIQYTHSFTNTIRTHEYHYTSNGGYPCRFFQKKETPIFSAGTPVIISESTNHQKMYTIYVHVIL